LPPFSPISRRQPFIFIADITAAIFATLIGRCQLRRRHYAADGWRHAAAAADTPLRQPAATAPIFSPYAIAIDAADTPIDAIFIAFIDTPALRH